MSGDGLLRERGSVYGPYSECARISQQLKEVAVTGEGWQEMSLIHRESIDMIFTKLSRALSGDPKYLDNYKDIIGYTQLIINHIEGLPNE